MDLRKTVRLSLLCLRSRPILVGGARSCSCNREHLDLGRIVLLSLWCSCFRDLRSTLRQSLLCFHLCFAVIVKKRVRTFLNDIPIFITQCKDVFKLLIVGSINLTGHISIIAIRTIILSITLTTKTTGTFIILRSSGKRHLNTLNDCRWIDLQFLCTSFDFLDIHGFEWVDLQFL